MRRLFLVLSGLVLVGGLSQASIASNPKFPASWQQPQPQNVPRPQTSPTPAPRSLASPTELEQAVYLQVNQYRVANNLPPLKLDSRVTEQARAHSRAMANKRTPVGHDGLKRRARAIALRGVLVRRVGENVAYIFSQNDPAKRAIDGWVRSPGHRKNLEERRYSLTGVGVAQDSRGATYITQIYVRKW